MVDHLEKYRPYLDWIEREHQFMCDTIVRLADINSGTDNLVGIERVCQELMGLFSELNIPAKRIVLPPVSRMDDKGRLVDVALGPVLSYRRHNRAAANIFLGCHMDTVFSGTHPYQTCRYSEQRDVLYGPGVADAKGGIVVMYTALKAFMRSPWASDLGWEVMITSDEEIGSPGSAALLRQAAARNSLGLIFEPALPDGSLASERKGSGNFAAIIYGQAAHAGRNFEEGRNAICALAEVTNALDRLNGLREGVTVNPGYVYGGGPENIVADRALLKFNIRIGQHADEAWVWERLEAITDTVNRRDGFSMELHGIFNRPPKTVTPDLQNVMKGVTQCGVDVAIPIVWKPTGGCCDGNNLAAAGLVNVDNLGVCGANLHSDQEYLDVGSLTGRAKLAALILMKLATGEMEWKHRR